MLSIWASRTFCRLVKGQTAINGFWLTTESKEECRARSDCTYVQAGLAIHSSQNKSIVNNY